MALIVACLSPDTMTTRQLYANNALSAVLSASLLLFA
jgi:hypothetical protein